MKKLLMAVAMAFISVAGFAQSGSWSVGLNFGYGTDISTVMVQTSVNHSLEVE